MTVPLADPNDVADLFRPLTAPELSTVGRLILVVSSRLRHAAPFDIDARIALFATDPTNRLALDPVVVASVVATIIKRFMANPEGLTQLTQTTGPFSTTKSYTAKSEVVAIGQLNPTAADIAELFPPASGAGIGSIRLGTGQIPYPLGPYGTPTALEGKSLSPAEIAWRADRS